MPTVSVDRREENGRMDESVDDVNYCSTNGINSSKEPELTETITKDINHLMLSSVTTTAAADNGGCGLKDNSGCGRDVKLRSRQIISKLSNDEGKTSSGVSASSSSILSLSCHQSRDSYRIKRRSMGISTKIHRPIPPVRSMSLPAVVPNLCLLGSFEESVLNGRLDPCGYIDGFTAELGASGSFIPEHVTLPVTTSFFNLSDNGTSPYLGQIDITNIGKRGYRIPDKGTIQLTLFNPNKTVVKIFVVHYDHSDMPISTSTFIRQKTITPNTEKRLPPSLHYLIHLRFMCSRSGRHYLHTSIKLLFGRKAPDIDTDIPLSTITEGPTDPKYGPVCVTDI